MKKLIALFLFASIAFAACTGGTEPTTSTANDTLKMKCDSMCKDTCVGAATSTVK